MSAAIKLRPCVTEKDTCHTIDVGDSPPTSSDATACAGTSSNARFAALPSAFAATETALMLCCVARGATEARSLSASTFDDPHPMQIVE